MLLVPCLSGAFPVFGSPSGGTASDYLLMVFLQPAEGRYAEFLHWYQDEHIPEVVQRPGFVNGRLYRSPELPLLEQRPPSPVLAAYGIHSDDLAATFREDARQAQASRLADPPLQPGATFSYTYEATTAVIAGAGTRTTGKGRLQTYEILSLASPRAGHEAESDVYCQQQLTPGIMTIQGLVSARCYQRSEIQRYSGAPAPSLLVAYTLQTDDPAAVLAEFELHRPEVADTASIDPASRNTFVYEALGPLVEQSGGSGSGDHLYETLPERIQALEDKEAIRNLLSRYSLNIDLGRAEDFLRLFTDDCVFATDVAGEVRYRRGKEQLAEMLAGGPPPKGQHLQLDYVIDVRGDAATAIGYQVLTGLRDDKLSLNRAAFRSLSLKRVRGEWLIHEVYTIGIGNEEAYLKILPPEL